MLYLVIVEHIRDKVRMTYNNPLMRYETSVVDKHKIVSHYVVEAYDEDDVTNVLDDQIKLIDYQVVKCCEFTLEHVKEYLTDQPDYCELLSHSWKI